MPIIDTSASLSDEEAKAGLEELAKTFPHREILPFVMWLGWTAEGRPNYLITVDHGGARLWAQYGDAAKNFPKLEGENWNRPTDYSILRALLSALELVVPADRPLTPSTPDGDVETYLEAALEGVARLEAVPHHNDP